MLLHCSDEPERWQVNAKVLVDLRNRILYDLVAVPADGDCFYSALCGAARLSLAPLALRGCVADTLDAQGEAIFPDVQGFADPIMTRTAYNNQVQAVVRKPGRWDCALGDTLPLIIARHVLRRTIRVVTAGCMLIFTGDDDEDSVLLHLHHSHYSYYRRRQEDHRFPHRYHPYDTDGPRRRGTIRSPATKTPFPVHGAFS